MSSVVNLPFMDLNSAAESVTLSAGLTFSGAVDPQRVEETCDRMAKAWPILGACIRRNRETNMIEAVVPARESARLKLTSQVINSTLRDTENLYVKTKTITTQITSRNEALYREHPLGDLEYYLSSGEPAFALHAAYLSDATIFTLTIVHVLMDASGFTEFTKAFILAMDYSPIPPLLSHDPWAILLPRALLLPDNPGARQGWTIWGAEEGAASRQAEHRDSEVDGPVQQRTIYFPAVEIARLKREALDDLKSTGRSIPFLSTNDVVVAWLYKHTFIDTNEPEKKNRFIYVIDARNRFPEAFLPGHAYLHNAFFNMSTEPLTDAQVHSMSLGEVAYMIRSSVQAQTAQDQLLSQLKWKHDHAGQTQIPFTPGDRMQFSSSWLSFGLGNLSITNYIKEGTGTGQVLDVIYDVKGSARSCSAIKFKDVEGGVVCDMDWGARRWVSGEMAKYAFENQT